MRTEIRFVLALVLMLVVMVGTNVLFPPVAPEETVPADSVGAEPASAPTGGADAALPGGGGAPSVPDVPSRGGGAPGVAAVPTDTASVRETLVTVESPLYRFQFSSYGARLTSAELPRFRALNHGGVVQLVPDGAGPYFGERLVVGSDTVDLSRVPFQVEPASGFHLTEGGGNATLRFIYQHPTADFHVDLSYTFDPATYVVGVQGRVTGVDPALLLTDLGEGLAYAEADSMQERAVMAYVYNHLQDGVRSTLLRRARPEIVGGPLVWAAFRNKYFVIAMLAGASEESVGDTDYLGGLIVREADLADRVRVETAQPVRADGSFAYRLYLAPQDYSRLASLGQGMDEVNPYGWKFLRPIVGPIISVIVSIFTFLHAKLSIGYGWLLIFFGLAMRIVLFPLTAKTMRAQLRNMAVQPLMQEIQTKYKDNPEKLRKEVARLYTEHGFNPLAGCLPMLLPWPVLIALFFVFRSTIELRGVPFLWLPDLSAKDPFYILPIVMAFTMFLTQWISLRSLDQPNPQMRMMMFTMPAVMLLVFVNLASGLNLYYTTSNLAMMPQQIWIANERKKMRGKPPPKLSSD